MAAIQDETSLVAEARRGRHEAFTELVKRHQSHQFRLAMRLVSNREDAEEVVQEALLSAWRNIPAFRGDASFRTWLGRITWNFGVMALRRRKTRHLVDDLSDSLDTYPDTSGALRASSNPEQSTIGRDFTARVRTLVLNLPRPQRDPLYLWAFEEMNLAEIARELSLNVPTVKIRLYRARQEVRRWLQAMGTRREMLPHSTTSAIAPAQDRGIAGRKAAYLPVPTSSIAIGIRRNRHQVRASQVLFWPAPKESEPATLNSWTDAV